MASTYRALNWIIQSLEAKDITCSVTPPELISPKKHKDAGRSSVPDEFSFINRQKNPVMHGLLVENQTHKRYTIFVVLVREQKIG